MYQNNGNQIVGVSNVQIRNIANSANSTVQLSSNAVANNIVKATTVVSRSIPAATSSTGTLMFSANRPQGGNPSTAAQLLGRQNLKKPASSNIAFGLQGIRNSPVIVPATTQPCTGNQRFLLVINFSCKLPSKLSITVTYGTTKKCPF